VGRVELSQLKKAVPFRKVAMGTWDTPMDPSVYGFVDIDMSASLKFLESYQQEQDVKISPMLLIAKAVAICLQERPEINGMIRFKRIYLRKHTRLFFQVNVPGDGNDKTKKANLSGCCIDDAETMSLKELHDAIQAAIGVVRRGEDKELNRGLAVMKLMPWSWAKFYIKFVSFLIYGLNLNLKIFGFPKDPFGSVMITNIGSLGIDSALAPLCAYTRTPLLLTTGAVVDKPWVVDGEVKVRPVMNIGVTFDHRLIDGVHAAAIGKRFKQIFNNPEQYF